MPNKIVVIDGKSVFYRGYYAMGHLSKADGTPTGGVYGFAVIAMEIVKGLSPDKVVVAWDKAHTSIAKRKAIYPEYKAGRVKPPEDFYTQIPLLKQLVAALGWGFLECDGYEADDIIGTLALQADHQQPPWDTYIVSSDLDMLQVVDANTRMYRLLKGFSKLEEIDVPAVEAKYGIKKSQFLDLKAIKGDASDNIPGVPGIGEKGAVKLLNQYGSLDGVYQHLDDITGSVQKKLQAGKDSAYMSYQLAKIMTDAPVRLDDIPPLTVDGPRIIAALKELEFGSLIRKFAKELGVDPAKVNAAAPAEASAAAEAELAEPPAADAKAATGDTKSPAPDAKSSPESSNAPTFIFPNIKQKMHADPALAQQILTGKATYWDLDQADFLLNPLQRKSADTAQATLNFADTAADQAIYQARYQRQMQQLAQAPKLRQIYLEYDLPLIPVLYQMEAAGIQISKEYFTHLQQEYQAKLAQLEQQIYAQAGTEFNVNSPQQLAQVLYERLGLPTRGVKKTQRGYSTGVKELDKLRPLHPVVPLIIEYREAAKLQNTYITPLPALADANCRIHTTFTQDVTATGRLSSLNPNLQNIPVRTEDGRRIRQGFVAAEGCSFVSADYSQFELRLAAVLAGDQPLIADFNSGIDIHTKTAADVFGVPMSSVTKPQRRAAKTINFGVLYGMSARGLAQAAGMGFNQAQQFIDNYFAVRRPIREYLDQTLRQAREEGYVETFYGRRRPTPDVLSPSFMVRTAAERAAINMPIQGTEADLMKRAMLQVEQKLGEMRGDDGGSGGDSGFSGISGGLPASSHPRMILQIHDSLVIECPDAMVPQVSEMLQQTMEGIAPELPIKLAVEVTQGKNWGEL